MGLPTGSARSPFRSLRHFLRTLVLAVVLPSLALSLVVASLWAQRVIHEREQDAVQLADHAAEGMSNHLNAMTASLAVLSRLPLDREAQLSAFYGIAKSFSEQVGYHVALADPEGRQFLSTRLPLGPEPPQPTTLDSLKKAAATGKPSISDVFPGETAGSWVITVDVPAPSAKGLRIITLSSSAAAIAEVLYRTQAPQSWLLGLIDGQGHFIARGRDSTIWTGKPAAPAVWAAAQRSDAGLVRNISVEGVPLLTAFHRVPGTDWRVLVGVPESALYAEVYRPLGLLAAAIVLVLGITLLLALLFARQLSQAMNGLMAVARAPLARRPGKPGANPVQEFEEISQVIQEVSALREQLAMALDMSVSIIRDMDGTIRLWTTGCERLYGWTQGEAAGRITHELLRTGFPMPLADIESILVREGKWSGELEHTLKDGRRLRISAQWMAYAMESGQRPVVVETVHDMSTETRLEAALRHSEERLLRALDAARMVSFEHDMATGRIQRQGGTATALGLGFEDTGENYFARIHPEDRPALLSLLESLAPENPNYSIQYRLRLPDGPYRWLANHSRALFDGNGRLCGAQGVVMDFEAQKQAEMALALHAERQAILLGVASGILHWSEKADMARAIFDQVHGYLDIDCCFNHRYVPDSGELELVTALGVSDEMREELAGMEGCGNYCGIVAETGSPLVADESQIAEDPSGEVFRRMGVRAYVAYPLVNRKGDVMGAIALASRRQARFGQEEVDFMQTIAYFLSLAWERRLAENRFQQLNQELERRVEERTAALVRSNLELQRFAYISAHDLQTPLRSIASFTQLLGMRLKDSLDPESSHLLQRVVDNARRMQTLIRDLLAYARLDAKARPLAETDLNQVVAETLRTLEPMLKESGARVSATALPTLAVDRTLIAQVFINLVENGIKYNHSEPIEVRISAQPENGEWTFCIRDNGIGIDPKYHEHIFTPFKRLHSYHAYPGTGVGLAICQRVVERHGGRMWIESSEGKGSAFYFTLPAHPPATASDYRPGQPVKD